MFVINVIMHDSGIYMKQKRYWTEPIGTNQKCIQDIYHENDSS